MAAALAVVLGLACGGDDDGGGSRPQDEPNAKASRSGTTPSEWVTLTHEPSKLRIEVPRGFRLKVSDGVYVFRKGGQSMSFSRAVTAVAPSQYGAALLKQIGGRVVSRQGDDREFTAQVDRGARTETLVVTRDGDRLSIATGRASRASPLSVETVRRTGASAEGGLALRAPTSQADLELKEYRTPDGGATAQVPAGPGWDIQGGNGLVQGSSDRGAFLLGYSVDVVVPERAPPNPGPSMLVASYLEPPAAVATLLPKVSPAVSDVELRRTIKEGVLPGVSSSGMYLFDYKLDGKPWTGVATVATDSPEKYGGFSWNFYYSGIGVPAGSDPAVGSALLRVWRSWNPSGAIAKRSQQAKELIDQSNDVWKETSEFRSDTADRQSRDVGCLLQGYYEIEDNSRKYDLPPLPCGQTYVPGD